MRTPYILTILLLFISHTRASEDLLLPVRQVEHRTDSKNTAIIELEQPKEIDDFSYISEARLKGIHLTWDGNRISVPKRDLKEITKVQWTTVSVYTGVYPEGLVRTNAVPYRTISFLFGDKVEGSYAGFLEAHFLFWGGEYRELKLRFTSKEVFFGSISSLSQTLSRGVNEQEFTCSADGVYFPEQRDRKYQSIQEFLDVRRQRRANKALQGSTESRANETPVP